MEFANLKRKNLYLNEIVFLIIGLVFGFVVSSILYAVIPKLTEVNVAKEEAYKWEKIEASFVPLEVSLDQDLQKDIYLLSYSYDLPFSFVMALIQQESGFQPKVVSETADWGLMQINEINHKWLTKELGITNFLNPYQNIQAGIYMLSDLFEKYKKPNLVLMAYNLGETGAKRLWKKKIYHTQYSQRILQYQKDFQKYLDNHS